jgi:hypothetical protein
MTGPIFVPNKLPMAIRQNPRRSAECRVYDLLKDQLKDDWAVYYSRPWLGLAADGHDKDGEADFVVAHPEYGLLILEVKGGRISYLGDRDEWRTMDRDGFTKKLRYSPASQASRSKHEILRQLRDSPGWEGRRINARIGVVFPDCTIPGNLSPDLPRFAVAGVQELMKLGDWIERRMNGQNGQDSDRMDELGDDGMKILHGLLAPSFFLEQPIASTLLRVEQEMDLLTDQQSIVLQLMSKERRLAIPGLAGTGKTALAVKKARMTADAGYRTLFLCFNSALAKHIRASMNVHPWLDIATVHAFVNRYARETGLTPLDPQLASQSDWSALLLEIVRRKPDLRFDAVIIDEGQDIGEGWLLGIDQLLRDASSGLLYVFFDDNQRVQSGTEAITRFLPRSTIELRRILRNTKPIAQAYSTLLPEGALIEGPDGPQVRYLVDDRPSPDFEAVVRGLEAEAIEPSRIAVLVSDEAWKSAHVSPRAASRFRSADSLEDSRPVLDTVRRFKGLEQQAVILVSASGYAHDPDLLYVAMSRAKGLLVLLDSANGHSLLQTTLSTRR